MKMKLLLVTTEYPYPAHSGDRMVTASLIEQFALEADIELSVFCGNGCPARTALKENIHWISGTRKQNKFVDFISLFSNYPRAALRAISKRDAAAISKLAQKENYDALIINLCACAPAIQFLDSADIQSKIIYLSHNAEALIRPKIAKSIPNPLLRFLQTIDAFKYCKLENKLIRCVDGITAMSELDAEYYKSQAKGRPCAVLKPAYSGERVPSREISPQTPPIAVLVGSFFWGAKQMNLKEILNGYEQFCSGSNCQFKLRIAGQMPDKLLKKLSRAHPDIEFYGSFADLSEVLSDARVALVLERLGGGFKLKILDYVFHRVPILAYPEAMVGSGLEPNINYIAASNIETAMFSLNETINDFPLLNDLQFNSFSLAKKLFNWPDRTMELKKFIQSLK